jgi:hypothetical protein
MSDTWVKPILPWTWSDYEAYHTCPKAFYELKFRREFKEIPHESNQWGDEVHKALEANVKEGVPLTERFIQYVPLMQKLNAAPGEKLPELRLAVDDQLQPIDYKDPNAWNRGKSDLAIINGDKALSIDYKTGKKKAFSRQLELDACRIFVNYPQVQVVHTAFAWLQTNEWTRAFYKREQLHILWEGFYEGVSQMLWSHENNVWPAKPSGLCKKSKRPGSTYAGCPVANCPHSQYYRGGR